MLANLFRAASWLASALVVAGFALLCIRGVESPRAADPTERALMNLTTQMVHHGPLYTDPSTEVPPALLPGFPLVAAVLVDALGPRFWGLRAIALLSTLLLAVLAMVIVHEETDNRTLGAASGCLILAGYGLMVGNPAVARPEPLMLVLALGGCLALRVMPGATGGLVASLMLSAASFTHPQAVWFAVAALVYLTLEDRGRLVPYTLGLGLFLGGGYLLLSRALGPWFNYHAWDLPVRSLRFDGPGLMRFVGSWLLGTLGVLTVTTVLSFALPTRTWRGPGGLWACVGVAAIAAALLATQSSAPEPQALAICVVALALVGPISMHRVSQHLSSWPDSTRMAGEGMLLLVLVLQFVALFSAVPPALLFPRA